MADYEYDYEVEYQEEDYGIESFPEFDKKSSYKILKEEEALKEREEMIKYATNRLDMERDSLILALIQFKWDSDILAERWYDKPDFYSYEAGIFQSPESIMRVKKLGVSPNNTTCLICYSDESEIPIGDFYGLSCNHKFCKDCWTEFFTEKLKEINTAILMNCPQQGCNCIVTESLFKITIPLSSPLFKEYLKSILKNFTDFNSVMKPCPFPGCEAYIHCEKKGNTEVTCFECNHTFCFKCIRDGHRPCPCDMIGIWEGKNQSESENVKWLQVNTKKCPACHKHIEKNQGCNHMTCRKEAGGCGHEFCWICMGDWKGHSTCNKFEQKDEKDMINIKHELDKYIFYFDRYMNHKKSLSFAIKMKKTTESNISKLNTFKNIPYTDLLFLREGVKSVIDSRRTLLNSYIFGYYMKEDTNNPTEKNLFEFHQGLLESNSDKIHGLLENTQIEALLAIDNLDEFNQNFKTFKNHIIDLYSATNKFCNNLVNSIENTLLDKIKLK